MSESLNPRRYVASWLGGAPVSPPAADKLELLLERSERLGVGGIVARELQKSGVRDPLIEQKIIGWFSASAERQMRLEQLAALLAERGLEAVALKGASLLNTAYAGQMSCRSFSDLDLLVPPRNLPAAQQAAALVAPVPAIPIDWHVDLMNSARILSRALLCRISLDEIWEMSYLWRPGIRFLRPELQFVHLSLHACKHSYARLMWLVDLVLVRSTCDEKALCSLARRLGAERPVLLALYLAEGMRPVSRSWAPLRFYEKAFGKIAAYPESNLGWGELFMILSVPGWQTKLGYLKEYLLPDGRSDGWQRLWKFLNNPDRGGGNA